MARKNSKIRRTPPFIRLLSSNHQYQITFTLISAILFTGLDAGFIPHDGSDSTASPMSVK
jgi:hypothetical protein